MLDLDTQTLLTVGFIVHLLMGVLSLMAAFHGRYSRSLLWCAITCMIGAMAYASTLIRIDQYWGFPALLYANGLLLLAYACLWTALRRFSGRPPRWVLILVGPVLWAVMCTQSSFVESLDYRMIVYSLLASLYVLLSLRELLPYWREDPWLGTMVSLVLVADICFSIYRLIPRSSPDMTWLTRPDFSVSVLENILFIVSMTFSILVLVNSRSERVHQQAARHDSLTGLANRRALFEWGEPELALARERQTNVSVLMCDLDHFKQVNDQFGHDVGNQVISVFAEVLKIATGRENFCARIGGEEFVVVAPGRGRAAAERLAIRIQRGLDARFASMPCPMTVSIGIATTAMVGYSLDRLLIRADQALYQAKRDGRDCYRVWLGDSDSALISPGSGDASASRAFRLNQG